MMSCGIEMLVNKQTIYRWPPNRLCYLTPCTDVAFLKQLYYAGLLSAKETFPSQDWISASWSLCASSPCHPNPVPKVLSFPQFVWKSRLWCLSSFVCALSLCQLASRGTAKWHPCSLSHSRHVLHLLTHGEWLTNTNTKTILTEQGLDAGGKKISRKTERVQHMLLLSPVQ